MSYEYWNLNSLWFFLIAVLWGVAFANLVQGVPIDGRKEFVGGFFDLLSPYALVGGLTWLLLFTLHGAIFLTLKTRADFAPRALAAATRLAGPAFLATLAFLGWTYWVFRKRIGRADFTARPSAEQMVVASRPKANGVAAPRG